MVVRYWKNMCTWDTNDTNDDDDDDANILLLLLSLLLLLLLLILLYWILIIMHVNSFSADRIVSDCKRGTVPSK